MRFAILAAVLLIAGVEGLRTSTVAASLPTFTACGVGLGTPSRINGAPVLWREYYCNDSDWRPEGDHPLAFGDIALCMMVDSDRPGVVTAVCEPVPGGASFCTFDYDRLYGQSILCNGLPDGAAIRDTLTGRSRSNFPQTSFCIVLRVDPPEGALPTRAVIDCADTATVLRAMGW